MVESPHASKHPARLRRYGRIAILLLGILLLNLAGTWLGRQVNFQLFPRHEAMLHTVLLIALIVYILLMATPFMPGIEVGLAVMLLLGSKSALLIYLCTLVALSISYLVGKFLPLRPVRRLLDWLYLNRASELVSMLEPLDRAERLAFLRQKAPAKFAPFLLRHRFAMIAVLVNLPGNALIGGGGGIGLVVGMSRLVPFHTYFLVIALAVAPLPLLIYFQGS